MLILGETVNTNYDNYVPDQARGQDGGILVKFFFCVFMDRDKL